MHWYGIPPLVTHFVQSVPLSVTYKLHNGQPAAPAVCYAVASIMRRASKDAATGTARASTTHERQHLGLAVPYLSVISVGVFSMDVAQVGAQEHRMVWQCCCGVCLGRERGYPYTEGQSQPVELVEDWAWNEVQHIMIQQPYYPNIVDG